MTPTFQDSPGTQTPPLVCYVLQAFAVVMAVVTVIGVFVALADLSRLPEGTPATGRMIFASIVFLVFGLAVSAAMAGLSAAIGHLSRMSQSLAQIEQNGPGASDRETRAVASAPPQPAPAPVIDKAQFEALQRALEEVRDNVLLTEDERRTKRQRLVAMERRERTVQIQQALDVGRFQDARALLLELERRIGGDEATAALGDQIEAAAQRAESEDVAAATKQCEDLMSLTSWDRALKIAEDLIDRHPNALPAKQLLARVQRERQVHQQEHRNRLYVEIQRHTSRREWHQALQVAGQLIAAYPDSIEAESLRSQLETLTKNAEIEHRRELEVKYKSFIEDHKLAEALALAREVISLYPESPQAKVMREQIPALEKRVHASIASR